MAGYLQTVTLAVVEIFTLDRILMLRSIEKPKSRHRLYCRSKIAKGQQRQPKRSRVSCVRAKARFDLTAGKCARCKSKGLSCEWPQRKGYLSSMSFDLSSQIVQSDREPKTTSVPNSSMLRAPYHKQEERLRGEILFLSE